MPGGLCWHGRTCRNCLADSSDLHSFFPLRTGKRREVREERLVHSDPFLRVLPSKFQDFMRILFIGDIFGRPGRTVVKDRLPGIVRERGIDLIIANGENSAAGFGITPALAEELFELNIDVITTGNHVWDKREIIDYFQMV